MMKPRNSRKKRMAEINVVPYIDVTLVLLIIFMITAPMLQTGVDVDLPQTSSELIEQDKEPPLVVSIDKQGNFFLSVGTEPERPIQAEELTLKVMAVLKYKPETSVLIRGDAEVNYGRVVTVMAALKQSGIPKLGLVTRAAETHP